MNAPELAASVLLLVGGLLLVVAALGVLVFPDALSRQHAATKAGTFALSIIGLAALLAARDTAWTLRIVAILVFLLLTLPLGSHLLARAAVRDAEKPDSRAS